MTTTTSRSKRTPTLHGTTLVDFLNAFLRTGKAPAKRSDLDQSLEVAEHLAMAELCLQELGASGVDLALGVRQLVSPHLDAAWRELLYIRQRLTDDQVVQDLPRRVTLSRKGKILFDREYSPHIGTPADPRLD